MTDVMTKIATPQLPKALPQTPKEANKQKAIEVGKKFEEFVISEVLIAPMFENVKTDGMFGGGFGEEIYRSFLNTEYAKAITNRGGIGIAEAVTNEILHLQEKSS